MKYVYRCVCTYQITYEVDKYFKPSKIIKCPRCSKSIRYMGDDLDELYDADSDTEPVIQPEVVKKMKFKIGKTIKKELTRDKKTKTSSIKKKPKKSNK